MEYIDFHSIHLYFYPCFYNGDDGTANIALIVRVIFVIVTVARGVGREDGIQLVSFQRAKEHPHNGIHRETISV